MTQEDLFNLYLEFVDTQEAAIQRVFNRLGIKNDVSPISVHDAFLIYGHGFSNLVAQEMEQNASGFVSGVEGDGGSDGGSAGGNGATFNNIAGGISSLLNGIGGIIGSWKGTNANTIQHISTGTDDGGKKPQESAQKTPAWVWIIVAVVVLAIGFFIFKTLKK